MTNQELYDRALQAIRELFADMSVTQNESRINLKTLRDEIDIMIDGLDAEDE